MRILSFGSMNIDDVFHVDHFVRAGETLSSARYAAHAGGKGLNQSIALARAGATVRHAGCVGHDGLWLKALLDSYGVDTSLMEITDTPTGHAIIQVDPSGGNCILLYGGANQCVTREMADKALADAVPGDMLLLQNEISELPYIMAQAQTKGMRIAFNPSPISPGLRALPMEAAEWLILNEVEGKELTGETDPDAILDILSARYPAGKIVLTLGGDGVRYAGAGKRYGQQAIPVKAVDTTAAGDTFTGFFLAGIAAGRGEERALLLAARAAALSVTRNGAAESIPTLAEAESFSG
jgi:ribokinase